MSSPEIANYRVSFGSGGRLVRRDKQFLNPSEDWLISAVVRVVFTGGGKGGGERKALADDGWAPVGVRSQVTTGEPASLTVQSSLH